MERTAKRRILSFAVAVAVVTAILLAATLPVGAATSSIMIGASTPAELFDLINNHPADHLDITIDNQDGSVVENGMLTIQNGKTVTLQSTDPSRFAMKNVMVHIQPDSELVLRNIRIEGVTDGSVFGASGGDSVLVINGTAVIENGAVLEGGESETTARGGAAYVAADGTLIMRGGVLRNNRAPQGGAILNLGTVRISGGEIYSNEAAVCGGAIANRDGGSLEISGGRIYGNQAAEDGGAIYTALSSNVEITGGRIYGNEAAANGGGMCSYESRLTVSGGQIVDNTAGQGGAVFNGGELRVSGGALLRSEQIGQGVCSSPAGTLHVDEALTIERAIHLEGAPDDYEGMEVARRNPHIADQAAYFHYIPGNYRVADRYNPEPAAFHMLVLEAVTVPPLNNRPSDSGSSDDSGSTDRTLTPKSTSYIIDTAEMKTLIATSDKNGWDFARASSALPTIVKADAWKLLTGKKFVARTTTDKVVQVQLTFPEPTKFTTGMQVSGWVKGSVADSRRAFFEKWYGNELRMIHLEHSGSFGQSVEVAAKVDLTGMDKDNLYIYRYHKTANSYSLICKPGQNPAEYWIDANGYLRFSTDKGGDFVVSENVLARK